MSMSGSTHVYKEGILLCGLVYLVHPVYPTNRAVSFSIAVPSVHGDHSLRGSPSSRTFSSPSPLLSPLRRPLVRRPVRSHVLGRGVRSSSVRSVPLSSLRRSPVQRSPVSVSGIRWFTVRPVPVFSLTAFTRPALGHPLRLRRCLFQCSAVSFVAGVCLSTYTPLLRPTRSLVPHPIPCCAFATLLLGVPPVRRAITGAGNIFLCRTIQLGNSSLPDLIGWGGEGLPVFSIWCAVQKV